jgi:F-type H+-transporting ATPase subunit b
MQQDAHGGAHDATVQDQASGFAPEVFLSDPSFWAMVGLLVFLGLLLWRKVPATVTKSLDERAARISSELAAAEALRKEAEAKLEDAKRRQLEAETEAQAIVEFARKEAAQVAAVAAAQLNESIARRQKMAEERIARAEAEALRDVKLAAVQTASRAAGIVLAEEMAGKAGDAHFAASLESVKKALAQ